MYKNSTILQLNSKKKSQLQSTWVKFKIQNKSNDKIYLKLDNLNIPYCDIYIPVISATQSVSYQVKKIGMLIPNNSKEFSLNYHLLSLLTAQDTSVSTIYLRFEYKRNYSTRLYVSIISNFFQQSHKEDIFYGVFFGIIFIMFFYNLFIYISVKDSSYLWYCMYVVSRGGLTLINRGYGYEFFWSNYPQFNELFITITFHLTIIFSIVFSIKFLDTSKYAPLAHKGLIGFIFALIISFLAYLFFYFTLIFIWQTLTIIIFLYLFILAVYIYFKGNKTVYFYILASIFFMIGFTIFALRANQIIPYSLIPFNTYAIGVVLEIAFFSFALANKIKILKNANKTIQEENLKLIREQNESLEQKVKKRTVELENKNKELQTQENKLRILNEQLVAQKDNLYQINNHLEDLVDIKVKKVKEQNKQLADYAFFNSHKVRGALARVMGICILIEYDKDNMSKVELFDLIDKLLLSANELDFFVKEINVILDEKPDTF